MAKVETIIIWEKSFYCDVQGKGWRRFPLARIEDAVALVQEHFKAGTKISLAYDPDVLLTEYTECPSGGRNIVREAVSSTHEVIANIHTAWGYQTPAPIPGSNGSNSTFCSYETAPSLFLLKQSLEQINRPIQRAFPLLSLATQSGGSPGRTTLFIVVDQESQAFVYLHTATGVRACRKLYAGKREDYYDVWAEISLVLGEYGVSFEDGGQRPQIRIYQAPGTDVKTQCPYWAALHQMAQVEVYNLGPLAALLSNFPVRHCSSLLDDMPRTVRMDMGFQIAAGIFGAILLGFGIYAFIDLSKDDEMIRNLRANEDNLNAQKQNLERNKKEMEMLQKLYAKDIFEASKGRLKFLHALPASIPADATLTLANAGMDVPNGFRLIGIFWNASLEKTATAGRSAAAKSDAITPIRMNLATRVPGLLIDDKATSFLQTTGDFTIVGTTPAPQVEGAPAKSKPNPATPAPQGK